MLVPYRKTIFAQDQIYHVFNRGVASLPIFLSKAYHQRFIQLIEYYRFVNTPISFSHFIQIAKETKDQIIETLIKENIVHIEILAFCLMPNHFHFLLKQISDKGIIKFMSNLQNGYVKYLNIKGGRVGPLFQSAFKAKHIESDEQLLHVSRYIHLNPTTSYLVSKEKLSQYPWSSFPSYIGSSLYLFVNTEIINSFFKDQEKHKEFIIDQIDYQRQLANIKHLVLE